MTPDTEFTLSQHGLTLTAAPYGASLRGLVHASSGNAIITGYSGAANKKGGQGDVLIPFPGRVAGGQYTFGGQTYQMERNDKDGPNAIHGFLRSRLWDTSGPNAGGDAITFTTEMQAAEFAPRGYPFSLRATVTYELMQAGMACRFAITNLGDGPAPVGAGFHPYFSVGSEWIDTDTLQVPCASYLEFDDGLIPTGNVLPVAGTPLDFTEPRPIGDTKFNTCYANPVREADGFWRVSLWNTAEGHGLTVAMDEAFHYLVLYSGDPLPETHRRRALAIEPMTCGADALHHPEWGLSVLEPDQTLSGTWMVTMMESRY